MGGGFLPYGCLNVPFDCRPLLVWDWYEQHFEPRLIHSLQRQGKTDPATYNAPAQEK